MNSRRRDGMTLILVLVLIAIMAAAGFGLSERMFSQRKAVQTIGRRMQARALAASGVELARQFLDRDRNAQDQAGGWYDNPSKFGGVLVVDDELPDNRGRFAIVAPRIEDRAATGVRYGLEDECAKINLRTLLTADKIGEDGARKMLMALPGMTESTADAILDWIDADDDIRPLGAEAEYYTSQTLPYAPRNAPPATLEELLLVRGVTPQLLFGRDAARMADSPEAVASLEQSPSGVEYAEGTMDHGWAAYLTLYSMESNLREDGTLKINLNGDDLKKLYDALEKPFGAEWATFIVAYRQNGSKGNSTPGQRQKSSNPQGKLDLTQKATTTINTVLDLIGVRTSVKYEGAKESVTLDSPFYDDRSAMRDYLPKLLDDTTVSAGSVKVGRININQAPRLVLSAIPQMTPEVVDQIIANRTLDPRQADPGRRYATWLLTEGIVPLATMKLLLPMFNGGGCVYRADSYGFYDRRGPVAHLEVFLDASKPPTGILFWKDISHLGIGYAPHPPDSKTDE